MLNLPQAPIVTPDGVYAEAHVYHHTGHNLEPVDDGVQLCHIAVAASVVDGHVEVIPVAPDRPLPFGAHWATAGELTALELHGVAS